jgi:hypothetical protein
MLSDAAVGKLQTIIEQVMLHSHLNEPVRLTAPEDLLYADSIADVLLG